MKFDGKWLLALPAWLRAGRADFEQAHQRRSQPGYLAKKKKLKLLWLAAALMVLPYPQLGFAIIVLLFTVLLSLAILDS